MNRFFQSRIFGFVLLGMLGIIAWISGVWQAPLLVRWNTFPSVLFWVELAAVLMSITLILLIVIVILMKIRQDNHHTIQ
jgi:hypothetical protein